jgi:hypothetical protein
LAILLLLQQLLLLLLLLLMLLLLLSLVWLHHPKTPTLSWLISEGSSNT